MPILQTNEFVKVFQTEGGGALVLQLSDLGRSKLLLAPDEALVGAITEILPGWDVFESHDIEQAIRPAQHADDASPFLCISRVMKAANPKMPWKLLPDPKKLAENTEDGLYYALSQWDMGDTPHVEFTRYPQQTKESKKMDKKRYTFNAFSQYGLGLGDDLDARFGWIIEGHERIGEYAYKDVTAVMQNVAEQAYEQYQTACEHAGQHAVRLTAWRALTDYSEAKRYVWQRVQEARGLRKYPAKIQDLYNHYSLIISEQLQGEMGRWIRVSRFDIEDPDDGYVLHSGDLMMPPDYSREFDTLDEVLEHMKKIASLRQWVVM